jgi:hypothetical protein
MCRHEMREKLINSYQVMREKTRDLRGVNPSGPGILAAPTARAAVPAPCSTIADGDPQAIVEKAVAKAKVTNCQRHGPAAAPMPWVGKRSVALSP